MKNLSLCVLLVLVSFLFFGCAKPKAQYAEANDAECQNNKIANQYIAHWKNTKPTLVIENDLNAFFNKNSKELKFIEPNYHLKKQSIYRAESTTINPAAYTIREMIHTESAWRLGFYGQGIQVAVVDTGVDTAHPLLRSHLAINKNELMHGLNHIDDDHNGFIDDVFGWNFISSQPDSIDETGHGTAIAGIITGDFEGPSLAMAPQAQILAVDFMTETDATEFHAQQAIAYALSRHVQIINNSWTMNCSILLKDSFTDWNHENVIFVNASGNSPVDVDTHSVTPAAFNQSNFLNVGSTNDLGSRSSFSGYGKTVNLFAPGEAIPIIYTSSGWDLYRTASGTSFSAAIVSGAAALVWSAYPQATALEIISLLHDGADQKFSSEKVLNIKKSLELGQKRFGQR